MKILWIEIKSKSSKFLICNLYRQPNGNSRFWDSLKKCLEKALDICDRILIIGDINEDQFNINKTKYRNILMHNNLRNVKTEPTCVTNTTLTLKDPIAITNNIKVNDAGIFNTIHVNEISK